MSEIVEEYWPHHEWGDNWPYWQELYEAEFYIRNYVYKHSLCRLSSKEKYGTIRYESLTPPKWAWYILDCWIYFKWIKVGQWALKRAIKKACKRFPNCKAEILDDLSWGPL